MDKHRTAVPRHAGLCVVVDFNNQIIELIVAPQPVTGAVWRYRDVAIVAPVSWILAPGVARADSPPWEQRDRARHAVGAPPQPPEVKNAARRCAVAFPFVRPNAAATERYRKGNQARNQ